MKLKLFCSNPVEALRQQVRERANSDPRFKKADQPNSAWCEDLIAPDGDGPWKAVICSSDSKLFEVPFTIDAGVVKLGDSSREVFRSIRYLPLAAKKAGLDDLPVAIRAKQMSSEITSANDPWMYAPGGDHTITPGAGDGSAEVTLRIDASTAAILNASLAKLNKANDPQRAFIDYEHDEAKGATSWPIEFVWSASPQPGIYLKHEPSALGKELVDGKIVRAFSPSIYSDADLPKKIKAGQHVKIAAGKRGSKENPARITGLVYPAIGTLTNNPAFKKILPLWAKAQAHPAGETSGQQ